MRHKKEFDSAYRLELKESYLTQINKVRRLLTKDPLTEEEMAYYTVESAERQLILELLEFSKLKELPQPIINDDKYIYRERDSRRSTYGYYTVIIYKKYYGHFPFKKDAIKKRNEVLIKLGKI